MSLPAKLCAFVVSPTNDGKFQHLCPHCGTTRTLSAARLTRVCGVPKTQSYPHGAGTELAKLLHNLGIVETPKCECKQHVRTMNRRGVAWCEANIDTIVDWLAKEAAKQNLQFMFSKFAARQLVRLAIRRARKAALLQT